MASIPEATCTRPNFRDVRRVHQRTASFERLRPRSRVLVVSRRPTRVRNLSRHLQRPSEVKQASTQRPPPARRRCDPITLSRGSPPPARAQNALHMQSAPQSPRLDGAPSIDHVLETSVSTVDLDSFPLPPSSNKALLHARGVRRRSLEQSIPNNPRPVSPASLRAEAISPAKDGRMSGARRSFGEAAVDIARASKHTSIDSVLVEAISRTIVQQIRLFSAIKPGDRRFSTSSKSSSTPAPACDTRSRTSSQREALDHFARGLRRYADNTGARGKPARSPPDAVQSGESLRTVSALMPFRPEFRAAGLAVTSKDQGQRTPGQALKAGASRFVQGLQSSSVSGRKYLHPSQMDGYQEGHPSTSIGTEISFAPAQDMDEWRYALIDEAPPRRQKRAPKTKKPKKHCLPCFPGADDEHAADADWAHFRPAPANTAKRQELAAAPSSRIPPLNTSLPSRSVAAKALPYDSNSPLSPRHAPGEPRTQMRHGNMKTSAALEPVQKSRATVEPCGFSDMLPKARAPAKARHSDAPSSQGRKVSSRQDRGTDALAPRSQSAKTRPARGVKNKHERKVPSKRP